MCRNKTMLCELNEMMNDSRQLDESKKFEAAADKRLEVVMRSFHIMQYNLANRGEQASRNIEPEVGDVGWFEFERARQIMDEGYRAYRSMADSNAGA